MDSGKSENKVFHHGSHFRSAACQHFGFPIKDGNYKTADKLKTARKLSIVLHFQHEPEIGF